MIATTAVIVSASAESGEAGSIRYTVRLNHPAGPITVPNVKSHSVVNDTETSVIAAPVGSVWPVFLFDGQAQFCITETVSATAVGSTRSFARISAITPAGSNKWQYAAVRQIKTGAGYGGWSDNGAPFELRNTMEENNTGSGIEGNGVNVGTLPDGFSLRPLAIDAVVPYWTVKVDFTGETEYWCSVVNAVDGECQ